MSAPREVSDGLDALVQFPNAPAAGARLESQCVVCLHFLCLGELHVSKAKGISSMH